MTTGTRPSDPKDTAAITGRRELHFNSVDEVLADVEQLAAADREGRLEQLGNWTLGQNLHHLSSWVDYSYSGSPLTPPLWLKLILKLMKKKFLYGRMRAGVRIPKVDGGTIAYDKISSEEGVARYRNSLERLRNEAPTKPNSIFGPMTHDEWIQGSLRHAELHLSFLKPRP